MSRIIRSIIWMTIYIIGYPLIPLVMLLAFFFEWLSQDMHSDDDKYELTKDILTALNPKDMIDFCYGKQK